jgi:hypothetical protein
MIGPEAPFQKRVTARVGEQPHFAGTIHDDSSARGFGYRAALVPGICLYGFMSSLAVDAWGTRWLERGTLRSHSRRPVYDGETLTILAEPVRRDQTGLSVEITIRNSEGQDVALGAATLPDAAATAPALADFPVCPLPEPPPYFAAGELTPGTRLGSGTVAITAELLRESLAYFQQDWPCYAAEGIVHATLLQRIVSRHTNTSLALATPSIFVESTAQHFAVAHVGDNLTTSGVVTASYERRGNHYYDSDNVVVANGTTVIALIRRTAIYAARKVAAA